MTKSKKPKPKDLALRLRLPPEKDAQLRSIMARMCLDPERHPKVNKNSATMYAIEIAAGVAEG